MSLYVIWINLIKEKATESWLTDSQRKVYDALIEHWGSHPFVNLYGALGSGKSFIARILAKERNYRFVQDLAQAPQGTAQVVLDDAVYSRSLRPLARDLNLGRVVLITEMPIRDAMPKVSLELSAHDVRQFCANITERCGFALINTMPEGVNLNEILLREIIARGEANVSG